MRLLLTALLAAISTGPLACAASEDRPRTGSESGRLTLTTNPILIGGQVSTTVLVWERAR